MTAQRAHETPDILAGVILIAIGGLLLMNNLGILHIRELLRYWPVGLIAIGVYKLLEGGRPV